LEQHDVNADSGWVQAQVEIKNRLGLHARPAMYFVDTANQFSSEVEVCKDGQHVDGKSIMHLMMLAATQGTRLTIRAKGSDAQEAIQTLSELIERNFDEEE
jgi:phosphocarrier protein